MASVSKSERSYIQSSLHSKPAFRADGRGLSDFRNIFLETGFAPLANGSARVNAGKSALEGGGGTEVIAAVKLEVEDVQGGADEGRIVCNVSWCVIEQMFNFAVAEQLKGSSPAAYSHVSSNALDDLQYDYTTLLHQALSHPTLHPKNLGILPKKKAWLLHLDVTVLSDAGNAFDVVFMAARAALWDTKVPGTRSVQYAGRNTARAPEENMDIDPNSVAASGFNTREVPAATDFELADTWDEGDPLEGRERWPVCITLNIVSRPVQLLPISAHRDPGSAGALPRCNFIRRSSYALTPTAALFLPFIVLLYTAKHEAAWARRVAVVASERIHHGSSHIPPHELSLRCYIRRVKSTLEDSTMHWSQSCETKICGGIKRRG